MAAAAEPGAMPPTIGDDARAVLRHAGIAAFAGAVTGLLVGGVLGRIAMLVLRLTSGEGAIGVTSDDGFEIGRVTLRGTLTLMSGYSFVGLALGLLYAVARWFLPRRGRVAIWTVVTGAVGGESFVHADGVDYALLSPLWLAIAFFVALPALAGLCIALLVEHLEATAGTARWQVLAAGVATVVTLAVPVAVAAALLALGRAPVLRRLPDRRTVRALAFAAAAAIALVTGIDLAQESRVILGR